MSKVGIQVRGTGAVRTGLRGGGIAKRGTGQALKSGGRAGFRFGGGRTNLLEELGRVEAEPSNRNRRAEISRVHGELNRGYAKGGVVRRAKKFKTHGKDVPTMAAEGGRIGLKKGKMPWGVGPKPGTLEHFQHTTQTPKRKRKAIGGVLKAARILGKKFKKKKVYPETEDLTHQVGPYAGDVGSEGKRRTMGPKGKGKSPGRPQAPGPKGRRPWRRAIPGRPRPGTPAPKFGPGKPRDPRTKKISTRSYRRKNWP